MTTVILKGQPVAIKPPVFKVVKQILTAYNALADPDDVKRAENVALIFTLLVPKVKAHTLKEGELLSFLETLPDICGLKRSSGSGKSSSNAWGDLYAFLSLTFGWTYDYIDNNMTFPRLLEMQDYLEANPSIHVLAKGYLGYEPKKQQSIEDFMRAMMPS